MSIGQNEKLKDLIQTSVILSPEERAEWLTLLDLMNDKQQAELEKILTTGIKNSSVAKAMEDKQESPKQSPGDVTGQVGIKAQTKASVVNPPPVKADKAPMQMPPLSHITNLPNLQRSSFNLQRTGLQKSPALHPLAGGPSINLLKNVKLASVVPTVSSNILKSDADFKNKNGFLSRLKLFLTEKELPAGKPAQELELGSAQVSTKIQAPQVPIKAKVLPAIPPVVPASPKNLIPKVPEAKTVSFPERPKTELPVKNIPPIVSPKPVNPVGIQDLLKQVVKVQPVVTMPKIGSGGLNIQTPSQQIQQQSLEAIKKHIQTGSALGSATLEKTLSQVELKVNELADLAQLKPKNLENINLPNAVKKVKNLIAKFGYHDVVFTFEKSEAYKTYIQTGLELLKRQVDFEQLEEAEPAVKLMNREQFEKITDLLRQIQAG